MVAIKLIVKNYFILFNEIRIEILDDALIIIDELIHKKCVII